MDPRRVRSIAVVQEVVRHERDAQLRHFDGLDAKGGILVGFGGALIALSPRGAEVFLTFGRVASLISCAFAIWSFWPRRFWSPDVRVFRDDYLAAEPLFAELRLVDTLIDHIRRNNEVLVRKARRLKWAMCSLGIAALLVAVGLTID